MKLSPNFTLGELTKSQTGERLGINNTPGNGHLNNLRALCERILEPVRVRFGPFIPSSGFRNDVLNKAIGGSKASQHRYGQAVDFEVPTADNLALARWCRDNLPEFDQLILEYHKAGDPWSGWVHCSYVTTGPNRRQVLTAVKGVGYIDGLPD